MQQKSRTPTPTVMSTANSVPIENRLCAREFMLVNLLFREDLGRRRVDQESKRESHTQ
jgi:hypothetical protein